MKVFYAPLVVPGLDAEVVLSLIRVAERAAQHGFARFEVGYNVTDQARNLTVASFLENSADPDDVLVMLDCDHVYPPEIVERLAAHKRPVVGALYFGRRPPYEPMFFNRRNGKLDKPYKWPKPGVACAIVGTAAIAIQRRVFDTLLDKGFNFPYFRYVYTDKGRHRASEDMYFGECCEKAGIPHYVDTTISIPHMQTIGITQEWHDAIKKRSG